MDLRCRVNMFLDDTGATVSAFCKHINIHPSWYYRWINNQIEFSDELIGRVTAYLDAIYKK